MISVALKQYIIANTGLDVYIGNAPLNSYRCVVIDDNGDDRDEHWGRDGQLTTGLIDHDFGLSVLTDMSGGGPLWAAQQVKTLISLLEHFAGPLTDTESSPNETHRVTNISCNDAGGGLDSQSELWDHSAFITVTYS